MGVQRRSTGEIKYARFVDCIRCIPLKLDNNIGLQYYTVHRAVAQLVSVHVWGTWGRRFKSGQPEILLQNLVSFTYTINK